MRLLLAAFAIGVLALQQQAELPRSAELVWALLLLAVALIALIVARISGGSCGRIARAVAIACAAASVGLGGFHYAGARRRDSPMRCRAPGKGATSISSA